MPITSNLDKGKLLEHANEYYNSKLKQFGKNDFRSLNWGDKKGISAKARYQQMFEQYNWTNKSVFEVKLFASSSHLQTPLLSLSKLYFLTS